MEHHRIAGGGGTQLHVVETGNRQRRPLLFIHGFSQCWLAWSRQINSTLADSNRIVAMDMRGHGMSEKPRDAYGDSKLWADDVNAVIESLNLDHPVLCGWSYGSLVMLDYVRYYGDDRIGGLNFVGGITKLGSDQAMSVISPEFLGLAAGFFSNDVEESARSLELLLRMCLAEEPSEEERYLMLGYNLSVPPHVRQALFARSLDNDDLLPKISKPVLITHGANDGIVRPAVVDQHKSGMPHAQIHVMENTGHAPFWDDAAGFNRRLQSFAEGM